MSERRGMAGQPERRGMAASWTWVPPAQTGYQEEGTSLLPLGRYRMPDGSQQVSFGLPQGLLDAYRGMRQGLGFEQDPQAPQGYVGQNAMIRAAAGGAGAAMTGTMGANAMLGALQPRNAMIGTYLAAGGKSGKFSLDYFGTPVQVLQNPSPQRLTGFLNRSKYKAARRVVDDETGDVYVWDAADPALHEMIAKELGIKRHTGDMIGLDD